MSDTECESDVESDYESDEEEEMKWHWIIGYKNLYAIYEDGSVYSMKSKKFLKPILDVHGYLKVHICKNSKYKIHKIHRLVAQYFIPNPQYKKCVDHINCIRTDNRIENLRWATDIENNRNMRTPITNTSGEKNVSFAKGRNKWEVKFSINGRTKHFGRFENYDDAVQVSRQKRAELHGEFANHD